MDGNKTWRGLYVAVHRCVKCGGNIKVCVSCHYLIRVFCDQHGVESLNLKMLVLEMTITGTARVK